MVVDYIKPLNVSCSVHSTRMHTCPCSYLQLMTLQQCMRTHHHCTPACSACACATAADPSCVVTMAARADAGRMCGCDGLSGSGDSSP